MWISALALLVVGSPAAAALPQCEGTGCFFSGEGRVPYVWFGVSAILAWVAFTVELVLTALHFRGSGLSRPRVCAAQLLLSFSMFFRALWFSRRASKHNNVAELVINRLSILLFFTGFTVYLETWLIFLSRAKILTSSSTLQTWRNCWMRQNSSLCSLQASHIWNVVINATVWLLITALSVSYLYDYVYDAKSHSVRSISCPRCNEGGYTVISVFCFLLSIGFLIYGCRMFGLMRSLGYSQRQLGNSRHDTVFHQIARKIGLVLGTCCICFLLRSIFWLWEPISGVYSPYGTYPFMHYTVTGILPSLLLFAVLAPGSQKRSRGQRSDSGAQWTEASQFSTADATA